MITITSSGLRGLELLQYSNSRHFVRYGLSSQTRDELGPNSPKILGGNAKPVLIFMSARARTL